MNQLLKLLKGSILGLSLIMLFSSCEPNDFEKGNDAYASKNYQEAVDLYSNYLKTHPEDAKTLHNRGRAFEELGKLENAYEDFRKAVDLKVTENSYRMSAGMCSFRMQKYGQTVLDMNAIIKKNPNIADTYYIRGRAYQQQGEVQLAIDDYTKSIELNSRNGEAFLYRGVLRSLTKRRGGCEDLKKAKNLGETNAQKALDKHCS